MKTLLTVILSIAFVGAARAGEIVFKNGDKLTGKITAMDAGKLTIESAVAGTVIVNMSDVQTFSTDEPVELHLSDGTVIKQQVATAPAEGTIATAGSGAIASQQIAIADVAKINPPPVKWTGSIRAGALLTRGNSETDQVSIGFDALRRAEKDRISAAGQYLYGRQEDSDTGDEETTTDNWYLAGKYDYFFNEKLYWFTGARIERDRIADLDLRFTPSTGLGYQWHESDVWNFNTEAGVAWVYEDFANADSNDYFAARLAYHYDRAINDKVKFIHNVEYIPSVEDIKEFNLNADAGLRIALTDKMFNELKVEWRHDSEPAPDADKNDMRYIIAIGWQF